MSVQTTSSVSSALSSFKARAQELWKNRTVKVVTHLAVGALLAIGAVAAAVFALPAIGALAIGAMAVLGLGAAFNAVQVARHARDAYLEKQQLELA